MRVAHAPCRRGVPLRWRHHAGGGGATIPTIPTALLTFSLRVSVRSRVCVSVSVSVYAAAVEVKRVLTDAEKGVAASGNTNTFKNDGSFLEMFKKMQASPSPGAQTESSCLR